MELLPIYLQRFRPFVLPSFVFAESGRSTVMAVHPMVVLPTPQFLQAEAQSASIHVPSLLPCRDRKGAFDVVRGSALLRVGKSVRQTDSSSNETSTHAVLSV